MKKAIFIAIAIFTFGIASAQTKPATRKSEAQKETTSASKKSVKKQKENKTGKNDPNIQGSGIVTDPKDAPKLDTISRTARPRRN